MYISYSTLYDDFQNTLNVSKLQMRNAFPRSKLDNLDIFLSTHNVFYQYFVHFLFKNFLLTNLMLETVKNQMV